MRASVLILLALLAGLEPAAADEPWHLDSLLPEPLSLRLEHRTRYERVFDQFRPLLSRNDQGVFFRTLLHGRLQPWSWLAVGAELMDSRSELQTRSSVLDTTVVNATELLQAYLELKDERLLGRAVSFRGGRLTLDVGSRRLVARNRFRNTINAFTGGDARIELAEGRALRAFYLLPVLRLPALPSRVLDNDIVFDEESSDVRFWGLQYAGELTRESRLEAAWFGLDENTTASRPNRNRQLQTPTFRIFRPPAPGALDFELEAAVQFGESRAQPALTRDLDHFAHFEHAELGYSFDLPASPRAVLQFDYASGDENPNDGSNGRFDTLFGARRFDFNPTGIYGPFVRANLITPGLRVFVQPHPRIDVMGAFRAFWLAERRDFVGATTVRDPSGNSGRYIGSQPELRVRFDLLPGNLQLETGWAHLFEGTVLETAPNASGRGDTDYFYVQFTLKV